MKKYSMFYTMLSMLSLLMVLASCKPNTNKSTDTLSVAESKEVKSTQYSRTKRQVDSEPQDTTNAHSNVLTIQFSIPEENTEGQPTTWSEKNSSYQIFYFPIASNNLSQNNLETIKSKLSLGEWIRNLPLHTQYPILHYYKEGSHPKDYTCYPIKARLDETIELNFIDPNNPSLIMFKGNGSLVDSGEPCRYIINTKSFTDSWCIDDLDIKYTQTEPVQSGDTVHILFIQAIQLVNAENSEMSLYLKPINLDNLNILTYTVKS